jgi:hypothetical protein
MQLCKLPFLNHLSSQSAFTSVTRSERTVASNLPGLRQPPQRDWLSRLTIFVVFPSPSRKCLNVKLNILLLLFTTVLSNRYHLPSWSYAAYIWQSAVHNYHYYIHGLGHAWSVPSSWTVCWLLHLNCGRPMFRSLCGFYVKIFFGIRLSSICRTCISTVIRILEFYYLDLKYSVLL